MFKLNSVGRKLYFSVLAVFLVFAVSFIVFQQAREKQYKIGTLTIKLENYNELLAEDLALSPGEGIPCVSLPPIIPGLYAIVTTARSIPLRKARNLPR